MYKFLFPLLLSLPFGSVYAADAASECVTDLDAIAKYLPANDTGAAAELDHHGKAIEEAFRKAQGEAAKAADLAACETVLKGYLRAWRPGHLTVSTEGNSPFGAGPAAQDKAQADARAPVFKVLDKDTILFAFGTFDPRYKGAVEALISGHRAELETHKNWIIDVRKNNGGSDSTYTPLLPWLLDGEYVLHRIEWLATPDNAIGHTAVCELLGDTESCPKHMEPVVRAVQGGKPGTYVMSSDERITYIRQEKLETHQPARVAVLVDNECGSSCEQFLLAVRGSFKVKLVGRPTYGSLDYSNMRPHKLPSGKRTLMYATSRSLRLPLMPIDQIGVQPDVLLLPKPVDDAAHDAEVRQVQRWLAGGTLRPQ
ncbi:S41 family peptidase [Massilia horti]|nr:S41 family peptidase [Massilia horti]